MARIFVSHAVKDQELVQEFVDLLHLGIGISPEDVFCSSLPGMGIPTGADFVQHIKSKVQAGDIVLLIISEAFLKSQFCHNEVGASWALEIPCRPLLVPPLDFSSVSGVLHGKQAAKINDKSKLSDLRDDLTEAFGLKPFRTSHWERARDKFLGKLDELTRGTPNAAAAKAKPAAVASGTCSSSGSLLKLHNSFFEADKVFRPEKDKLVIELFTESSEEEASLEHLRPHGNRGEVVAFAYQNDGGLVQIDKVESTSQGGKHHWTVRATKAESRRDGFFGEMNINNHSADDIAEMRAGRLLLNDPPPPKKRRGQRINDDLLEHAIEGRGDDEVTIECVVKQILEANRDGTEVALKHARLESVFRLKAARIVDTIFELSIGPVANDAVHVKFRGQRPKRYSNEEPEAIAIEGDCRLE